MNPQRERHLEKKDGKTSIAKVINKLHSRGQIKKMFDRADESVIDLFPKKNLNDKK